MNDITEVISLPWPICNPIVEFQRAWSMFFSQLRISALISQSIFPNLRHEQRGSVLLYLYETYENKSRREPICSLAFSIESNGPHCKVQYIASTWGCMVWVVYGDNGHGRREVLWADLSSYASTIRGSPWLVVRDFHAIRRHDERVEGSNEWLSWMDSLDECINQADFDDLRFWGQFFSWSNRREEGPILRLIRSYSYCWIDLGFPTHGGLGGLFLRVDGYIPYWSGLAIVVFDRKNQQHLSRTQLATADSLWACPLITTTTGGIHGISFYLTDEPWRVISYSPTERQWDISPTDAKKRGKRQFLLFCCHKKGLGSTRESTIDCKYPTTG